MLVISSNKCPRNINGILSTLQFIKKDCLIWKSDEKPIFDMLEEKRPNVLFATPTEGDEVLQLAKDEYNFKLVYFGVENTRVIPDLWCVPINTPPSHLHKISELCSVYQMSRFADIAKFYGGKNKKEYQYDVLYYSDVDITNEDCQCLTSKVFNEVKLCAVGPVSIPIHSYLGNVSISTMSDLIQSCKLGFDFYGIHDMDFAGLGLPVVKNLTDMDILLKNETERKNVGKKQKSSIINSKTTGFHITNHIMNKIGYDVSREIKEKLECLKLEF